LDATIFGAMRPGPISCHHHTGRRAQSWARACDIPRGNTHLARTCTTQCARTGLREMRLSREQTSAYCAMPSADSTRAAGNIRCHLIIDVTKHPREAHDYTIGTNQHFPDDDQMLNCIAKREIMAACTGSGRYVDQWPRRCPPSLFSAVKTGQPKRTGNRKSCATRRPCSYWV